ncbi:decaprenyl-phosphate phosphoribosyltransferase [Tumebacillus sp. DT12]|uniref:Decaprenyl-phosphate phosphoribosyltransferase n=1 Tax=Tumebacillus lacus TaxID=2995335 RepID=A0ABT3WYD5_9BACL|nr:decaprenyl-phosphate phosphoribosyltransferase [Tumebacillus lacus]MCX7569688.1 decaprenyl-phosphate phosphoribosyltransferase [Tumebacillus lacus]
MSIVPYVKLSRPKQWTKNLFVFGALFFSRQMFEADKVLHALLTFVAFCLISSAVYVLNDIVDVEKDRQHPKKKHRPLAAGTIKIPGAIVYGVLLLAGALLLALSIGWQVTAVLLAYFVMNILYSFWLKHVVLVDVFVIALGFVFRVTAGSYALPVDPSEWLLLCTLLLALFLGLSKRRAELLLLASGAKSHRKILDEYSDDKLIDQLISVVSAATIMAYALYTFNTQAGTQMMYTIPFVIYAIFRYLFLVYKRERGGEPANILLGDKPFLAACVLWALTAFLLIYLP